MQQRKVSIGVVAAQWMPRLVAGGACWRTYLYGPVRIKGGSNPVDIS